MMNFKNSKTAKVVSGFVGFATVAMMMGPSIASAATVEELTAQINALLAQVSSLQSTQSSTSQTTTTGSGYQFKSDLTIGSKGQAVTELQMILVAKGFLTMPSGVAMGYFGNLTKSAVMAWQASAGIAPAAGYVGPKSRAALNGMSSSSSSTTTTTTTTGMVPGCTSTSGFSATTGQSCATGAVVSTVAGCTSTMGFSPTTGQACSAATTSAVPGTGVTAALDATSPMSSVLIAGQSVGTLGVFRIMNGGTTEVKVTNIKFKRTGISSDTTLANVYLYKGGSRVTDAASVSVGVISFNDAGGIFMIPAGGSVSIAVRSDIALSTNGQTVGVMLTGVTAGGTEATGVPVSSAEHTIATTPTDMATINFTTTTVTPAAASIDPQNDYTVWQKAITVGSKDVNLKAMRFRQIGSVQSGDLNNFRLYVDGVMVGTAVASLDSMNYVNFMFATPATLKTGSRTIKLVADVVGGSNRNFQFSLRQAGDMEAADSQFGVTVLPCVSCTAINIVTAFSTMDAGLQTINPGTLTITKMTDSPSGNVVLAGSSVVLAKFTLRAQGEKLKVESLRVNQTNSNGGSVVASNVTKLRNGALFANGVQVGSTADIWEDSAATFFTQYNLGSSLILEPGKDVTLEVRADLADSDGTDNMAANDTIVVNIASSTASNVQRMASGSYFANTLVTGNSLTVAAGTLTLSKFTAYANQTVTSPQTAYKLGEFRLTSGSTEGVNLNTFTIANTGTITDMTNLYIVYGTKTSSVKAASSTSLAWSINETLAPNTTMNIMVYGTIGAGLTAGAWNGTLTVAGTSQNSGQAVTSSVVAGQQISISTGSLTASVSATTPVAANVVGNTMPMVASYKFNASNDAFTITELTATTTDSSAISEVIFKDGATEIGRQPFNGNYATKTGLALLIPANTSKTIDVYVSLGSVGTNAGQTGSNVGISIRGMKYRNSNGVETTATSSMTEVATLLGNNQFVYKTKPVITNVALPTSVLTAGTMSVYKFQVAADAGGTLSWRKISLNVGTSAPSGAFTVTGWTLYDAANESTALANVNASSGSAVMVDFTSSVDQEVSGSKTYVVKATIGGSPVTGSTVSHSIGTGVSVHTNPVVFSSVGVPSRFTWSDQAITPHTASVASWNDEYLVRNLPTDSLTLTK